MSEAQAVRDEFVQLWGRMSAFWGISPAAGRVFGWLISRSAGADAEEIVRELGMSRGAVSMACRELAEWGLVLPEKSPGARRVTYRPETDLERVIKNIVQTRKRREWDPVLAHLGSWIPRLERDRSDEARTFRRRLEEIETIVAAVDSMADSFLKGGILPRLGLGALLAGARRKGRSAKRRARAEQDAERNRAGPGK